jgi:Lrp/AsnC family transcriptional regulator
MKRKQLTMDSIDLRILAVVQADASLSQTELAERVGISSTACSRRVQSLVEEGIIRRRVALLSHEKLNVGVTVFVAVRTNRHSSASLEQFQKLLNDLPEVLEYYRIAGHVDYLIKAVVPDIAAYDTLYQRIVSRVELTEVTSMFAMQQIKQTTAIPLNYV